LPLSKKKNPHAEALGSLGGKARAQSLSDAEIAKIARKGGARAEQEAIVCGAHTHCIAGRARPRKKESNSQEDRGAMMRKQSGQIIRIGDRWYVRYWERRKCR
jgi:hypothetical protein